MKLIDYIIKHDSDIEWRKKFCTINNLDLKTYLMEGYCPSNFNSTEKVNMKEPFAPKKNNGECRYIYSIFKEEGCKCIDCWNREVQDVVVDEYQLYLKLKSKYEVQ